MFGIFFHDGVDVLYGLLLYTYIYIYGTVCGLGFVLFVYLIWIGLYKSDLLQPGCSCSKERIGGLGERCDLNMEVQ